MKDVEKLSNYIKHKYPYLNDNTITFYAKYFLVLIIKGYIKGNEEVEHFMDKAATKIKKIVYYDPEDTNLLTNLGIGKNNKGLAKDNMLFINNSLSPEMKEITFYHELTHLLQNYSKNNSDEIIGVMNHFKWRLLMEAQTQNLAEIVYNHYHTGEPASRLIPSEELRMLAGGTIKSSLRNYEMYDSVLRKFLLFINITMDDFIKLNFSGQTAINKLEDYIKRNFDDFTVEALSYMLDIIYSTDACMYIYDWEIVPDFTRVKSLVDNSTIDISSKNQYNIMKLLDTFLYDYAKVKINKELILQETFDNKTKEKLTGDTPPGMH